MTNQSPMPAARRRKVRVVTAYRHDEILRAARRVFAAHGFEGASMDDIARAASLGKGTLYIYYRSKRALYGAAVRDDLRALVDEVRRRVEAAATPTDKVRAFVETKLAFLEA